MNAGKVLFVGGDVDRLASIKIRCREIATRLGSSCYYGALSPDELPGGYSAYICVKPDFDEEGVEKLSRRGLVIWDILDHAPPLSGVTAYISSTSAAQRLFMHLGDVRVIPHYHCNFDAIPNDVASRRIAYVGGEHWCPDLNGIVHDRYFVDRCHRQEVVAAYRKVGIAINLRRAGPIPDRFLTDPTLQKPDVSRHIVVNSGIKLINCLGFGIPSISATEPAYQEIAPHCTIFSGQNTATDAIGQLMDDHALYNYYRSACLALAPAYHIDEIVNKYRMLIKSL